jgi:IclR family acetate operon transcriptional repressor
MRPDQPSDPAELAPGGARAAPASVKRVMATLEALAQAPAGASLGAIARTVGAPPSSLLSILRGLVSDGYLLRDGHDYRLAARSYALGGRLLGRANLAAIARPILLALSARTGETSGFSVLSESRKETVFTEVVSGSHAIRYEGRVGDHNPLHAGAGGRMILALLPDDEIARYLADLPDADLTSAPKPYKAELSRILRDARQALLASAYEEATPGAAALAAPVFDGAGSPLGALLLIGPAERFRANDAGFRSQVREAAAMLTAALGGSELEAAAVVRG